MTKEQIIKLLEFFGIKYKKYGEEVTDAIDIIVNEALTVTLSQFNDELEICTATEYYSVDPSTGLEDDECYGWRTYEKVRENIVCYVNKRDNNIREDS